MKAQLRWVTKFLAGSLLILLQFGAQPAHADTLIESGETLSGAISVSDIDAFRFYGEAGDRVRIDVDKTGGEHYFDTEMLLIDPDYLDEVDTKPGGDLLDHVLQKTGTYTILVQDVGLNHSGSYNITLLNLTAGPMTSVDDPDGGLIASGETLSGAIAVSDMDAYQFYGEAGDRVRIDVDKTGGEHYFNTEMLLIDPDQIDEANTQPEGDLLDHVLQKTGTYTILVQDVGLNHSVSYNITLLKLPGALSSPRDCDGGLIYPEDTLSGRIAISDMDAYQFYGEAGDRVLIDVDKTGGEHYFDTEMLLIDPDNQDEADTEPGGDRLDHFLLNTGLYTIVVQDNGLNHSGSYNVTLYKFPDALRNGIYDPDPATACDQLSEVTLTWDPVSDATGYDVFFGIDVIEPLVQVCSDVPDPSCTVSGLDESAVYYWKVVAHTAGAEIQGTVNWFVTEVLCDMNHDCGCDMQDWLLFGEDWGRTDCNDPGTESCECDLNNDGSCDMQDWLLFGQHWGWTFCP